MGRAFEHIADECGDQWFALNFDAGTLDGVTIYARADSCESAIEAAIDYADQPEGPAGIFWEHSAEDRAEYGEPDGWIVGHTTLERFDYAAGEPFVMLVSIREVEGEDAPPDIDVTEYEACADCYLLAGTGDPSSLDYHYGDSADTRHAEITAGMDALTADGGCLTTGDDLTEFSASACECCGSDLAGSRHALLVIVGGADTPAPENSEDPSALERRAS